MLSLDKVYRLPNPDNILNFEADIGIDINFYNATVSSFFYVSRYPTLIPLPSLLYVDVGLSAVRFCS